MVFIWVHIILAVNYKLQKAHYILKSSSSSWSEWKAISSYQYQSNYYCLPYQYILSRKIDLRGTYQKKGCYLIKHQIILTKITKVGQN